MITFLHKVVPLTLALALLVGRVEALHEMDHRYDITGYVLDSSEQPVSGSPVVVRRDGKRIGDGRTDSSGHYRIRVHLHDSDVGRELLLKTPDHEGTIRVTVTPGDTSTERIHHANFVAGQLLEGELPGRGGVSPVLLVAVGAGLVLAGASVAGSRLRRARRCRKRREARAQAAREGGRSKPAKRTRKRRGH